MDDKELLEELLKEYSTKGTPAPTPKKETLPVIPVVEEPKTVQPPQNLPPESPASDNPAAEAAIDGIYVEPEDFPTRIVALEQDASDVSDASEAADATDAEDDIGEQMTLEDFAPVETEPAEEPPAEIEEERRWEEQLLETRREKIRDFQIKQNREYMDFRYADEQAPDELPEEPQTKEEPPDELPEPEEEETVPAAVTGDFTEYTQAEDVRAELKHRCRVGRFRLWLSAAAVLLLLCSEFTTVYYGQPTIAPTLFLILNIALFTVMSGLLFPMLRDGVTALFRLKPNADTLPALLTAAVWVHTLLQWLRLPAVEAGEAPLFTAAAGVFLLLCAYGRLLKQERIFRNFAVVGDAKKQKYAAAIVQDERTAIEIGRRAVATGVPRIAYFRPVAFLDDFLANSYMDDRYDAMMPRYLPAACLFAAAVGVVAGWLTGAVWTGADGFIAALCLLLPAAPLALNPLLLRECRHLLETDNMLCGFAAAERLGSIDGVTLDISDLYLQGSVALHGIRTFGDTRIDEAIMDAAAVTIRTDGPLVGMFRRIIEDKTDILPPVENLVFEQSMGFSGWVNGRRVLVGNRKLLENHGIYTPSDDYEQRHKKGSRELVYLSVAGALSAMFIISYVTDSMIKDALHRLQKAQLSLLIRSCDPNVTEQSLCAGFRLDDFYVDLLSASAGRLYDHLRNAESDRVSAGAAVNGTMEGITQLLTACRRLRRRGNLAMLVQLGYALCGGMACLAAAVTGMVLPGAVLIGGMLAGAALSMLLPLCRR